MKSIQLFLKYWVLFGLLGLLQACGGGGGGAADPVGQVSAPVQTGSLVIGLTDAEGDFLSYSVDVTSISLQRADGVSVETLPLRTRVDFAELVEVTELVTVATIPVGVYESVSLGLDFSTADVRVQDDTGQVHAARLVDADGATLGALSVRLRMMGSERIRIAPGIPAAFSLDFDLDASNDIDLTGSPPTVTVSPFLLAAAELETDRTHRVRGMLAAVDTASASFDLDLRPFRHRTGRFGEFRVEVDDDTRYEINGEMFAGSAGLTELAALAASTPVVAGGQIEGGELRAETVLAGSSVPWSAQDVARGVVIGRSGDRLTLGGTLIESAGGAVTYRGDVQLLVGEDTRVTGFGLDNATLGKDSLSVGQRVLAFGSLDDAQTLDASSGLVRMEVSQLTGEVVQSDPLSVDLYSLNARRPGVYDFSGTGLSEDADPDFYEVSTTSLPLLGIQAGDLIRVRGQVAAFGQAPADFLALTLIDLHRDFRAASLMALWPLEASTPIGSLEPRRIVLDLEAARSVLKLRGMAVTGVAELALVAPATGRGVYALRVRGDGEIHLYREFEDLVAAITEQFDDGNILRRVGAHGGYSADGDIDELIAARAAFDFVTPDQGG